MCDKYDNPALDMRRRLQEKHIQEAHSIWEYYRLQTGEFQSFNMHTWRSLAEQTTVLKTITSSEGLSEPGSQTE
jgi:hypothetical protein